jgi:hypothetical protein
MYLETAGAASAAAGGLMLRQAFKVSVSNTTTSTRTMTIGGSATGAFNQGDSNGPLNMNVNIGTGGPSLPGPSPAPAPSHPASPKRPVGLIFFGTLLLVAGITMLCAGFYINREYWRV